MEFASADPSVVKSIKQRVLLNAWLRALRKPKLFPISISIEGGFKINNLMGLRPKAVPVILVRAIIDRDFASRPADRHRSDDVIELN